MTLWVCEIIWCWWQISKWLWWIGRLILATDSWRKGQVCSTATKPTYKQRDTWEWTQAYPLKGCCLTTCLSLLFCVWSVLWLGWRTTNPAKESTKNIEITEQLTYLWHNCWQFILWECIWAVMHYTTIVIRHSEIGDKACVIFIKIVLVPCRRTHQLHCIFTVFTEPHNNNILYRCACWKFNFIAV
jgi:hypothetical protein